jgi:hypothetical protein
MSDFDDLMLKCPLKQEVRASLYRMSDRLSAREITKPTDTHSPPMMDVKHLHSCGFIN